MSRLTDEELEAIAQRDIAYRKGEGDFAAHPDWAQAVEDRNALLRHIGTTMPTTVTTPHELHALPVGSAVVDGDHKVYAKIHGGWGGREIGWCQAGDEIERTPALPCTVLHVPG